MTFRKKKKKLPKFLNNNNVKYNKTKDEYSMKKKKKSNVLKIAKTISIDLRKDGTHKSKNIQTFIKDLVKQIIFKF